VQAPVGYFDPLGLTKDGDAKKFARFRASEIKHGRVAMIAAMGYIVPEYYRFDGYCSTSQGIKFADIPNGLAAFSKVPLEGWLQWIAFTGMLELYGAKQLPSNPPGKLQGADEAYGPMTFGNLGAPSLWNASSISDPEKKKRGLNSELANGRLAMMAITGMMFQNGYLGTTGPEMWFPSSAFEGELGVQAPVGYFDPLGLTKDGDAKKFARFRASEIKHGRVAMIAAMGYIVPEYFRFPGYCSTSQGIKFADIPNGLAAFSKVPMEGWMQWIAFTGMLELYGAKQDPSNPPGKLQGADEAYGPMTFGNLGAPSLWGASSLTDPEKKKRGLNSELANGRLAMMAITGMMFQNGYLGTTGPEMWFPSSASQH
jgi:Fe-S cluster biosynthesis and repair protein YggX